MLNYSELKELVSRDESLSAVVKMQKREIKEKFGREMAECSGYDQNNFHHCYTLLEHMVRTAVRTDADSPDLRIAALFHDIGKPLCRKTKGDRSVYYGHAEKSEKVFRRLCAAYGIPETDSREIRFYILYHDSFIQYRLRDTGRTEDSRPVISAETVSDRIKHIREDSRRRLEYSPDERALTNLTYLFEADAAAQAEIAVNSGVVTDTRENKTNRAKAIRQYIHA